MIFFVGKVQVRQSEIECYEHIYITVQQSKRENKEKVYL